ncbi:MAG: cellulose synthase family protein [Acidobacteriota bacterium]
MFLVFMLYTLAAAGLALYGFNTLFVVYLYWRKRHVSIPLPTLSDHPRVTVQLPTFDELYVVERLIDAAAALQWPREQLEIQVLDDSDDETTAIVQARVDHYRGQGLDISLIHRVDRSGFKAGALARGLERAHGEFIAIFDADFVPPRDFLCNTIPFLTADPRLGLVQTRWAHLNAGYSPLTHAQSIALDGHFIVEQTARSRNGLFFNFNGTAGVWRRACIEQCGGWHGDTLSEDLDLSYRAQLLGWKFIFLPDLASPAEIPPQIHAFKRQQYRWAKGSTQCLLKFGPVLVRHTDLPLVKRIEGLMHLSGYLVHPLILTLLITIVPAMTLGVHFPEVMGYFSLSMLGPILLYALSQRELYPDWGRRFAYFGFLMLLGTGVALNNTLAVLGAITGRGNNFRRTPKFRVEGQTGSWAANRYALPFTWDAVGELVLALYALVGVWVAYREGFYWTMPFMLLYSACFGFTGTLGLWHSLRSRFAPWRARLGKNSKAHLPAPSPMGAVNPSPLQRSHTHASAPLRLEDWPARK